MTLIKDPYEFCFSHFLLLADYTGSIPHRPTTQKAYESVGMEISICQDIEKRYFSLTITLKA